ncbi:SusC/RagA family TonB-linked outer membrane protein [Niastella sp. OAS944]|uniref:SusC/RagA family TonB-linked outer membrane protein n=1 Tax=Niastella sp. OAS944 TaxID=2664089 RepID=UPI0035C7A72C|nr:TonB-linked SusC/RagA family outer membrane protein [Chitinophagaceae bacterium OAS944]
MKLTAILLTISLLQVQAEGLSQTVTFSGKNMQLEKVFSVIKQQTGYVFLYTDDVIKDAKKVTLNVKDAQLEEVLKLAFKDQHLGYLIENKTIIISRTEEVVEETSKNNKKVKAPPIEVSGRVLNHKGEPLAGANVKVKGTANGGVTNNAGFFTLRDVDENATIEVSYLGFDTKTVKLNGNANISIQLDLAVSEMTSVSVSVYTGYQQIPKERATGSFVTVDNKLLNRSASLDVLSRMDGVASGLAFYRNSKTDQPTLNIRGRSTIFANATPLIILDNFPYDGDINNINPNTIESITVLRDAAAASIYGVRAANGVIVITSKKGSANQAPQTQFNTNITIGQKPSLDYIPMASSEDYIEVEKVFFARKYYSTQEATTLKTPVTPVAELMIAARDKTMDSATAYQKIEALKQNNNLRDQLSQYFLRRSVLAQNALTVSGGGNNSRYFVAIGYDKDQSSYVGNSFDRFSINASNQYTPFKNFDINTSLLYTHTKSVTNNPGINDLVNNTAKRIYPYAQIADEEGNALPVTNTIRDNYKTQKEKEGFLDWQYRPLDELRLANNVARQNYNRASIDLRKTFSPSFNVELKYQYEKQYRKLDNLYDQETYFVRNLVNIYYNPASLTNKYPIPVGDIFDQTIFNLDGHTARAQLNFNHVWQKHRVNLIGGFEVKQLETNTTKSRLYGYDDEIAVSQPIDYYDQYATNPNGASQNVPYERDVTGLLDRFQSYYANGSYTFNDRYIFSASGRLDNTNFFGVKANQRLLPLWSAGIKWNINREEFFKTDLFDQLAVKATYGYNGNINKGLTAYTTVKYAPNSLTKASSATVVNPPNPELRWEKVSMINLGVVFALKRNILSGSIEYFSKKGTDLIGDAAMDPTSGVNSFTGNLANMKGSGVDVQLTGKIIRNRQIGWSSTLLISRATDKVTSYNKKFISAQLISGGAGTSDNTTQWTPIEGRPVFAIYSYAWGGLDPTTGDPMGYVAGEKTKVWSDIVLKTTNDELIYNGPVNPTVVGAFRNDFYWKNLSISVNITCKMGHYFRRPSVDYGSMLNSWGANADLGKRWQKPGDEEFTNVPSIITSATPPTLSTTRDKSFYANTNILVQKADHIRLQDIVVSYDLNKEQWARLPIKNIHIYCNINNVGILWRANDYGIDPDALPNQFANFLPIPRSMTLGAKFDF